MMELIDVELSELARRSRSLPLSHTAAGLARGLEPGESVVLRARGGEYWSASVADLDFTLEDTCYRLEIGVRLPAEFALARVSGQPAAQSGGIQELLDLIGEVRRHRPDSAATGEHDHDEVLSEHRVHATHS